MSDLFGQVLYNDGEELTFQDLNSSQSFLAARLADQVFKFLIPHVNSGAQPYDPDYPGGSQDDPAFFPYALAIHGGAAYLRQGSANGKIQIAPGTLMQKIATADGLTPSILPFTFDGTGDQFTIANGDGSNPRVDLLQMKLELESATPTSVTFLQDGVKASIDVGTLTTHANTKYRAKVAGLSGLNISLRYQKRASGSGVTYSENGNACLVQYENGVSTNALVEASVIANSTLLEILSTGTGATILSDPADTFAYTHLTGGADQMLIPQSLNKKRRTKCTLLVKQGAAAVSPVYPDPDPGYCAVGAVVVGTSYVAAAGLKFEDTAGAVAVLHDQRIPLGIRPTNVPVTAFTYDPAQWTVANYGVLSYGAPLLLMILCPPGASTGRLLGASLLNLDVAAGAYKVSKFFLRDNGSGSLVSTPVILNGADPLNGGTANRWKRRLCLMGDFEGLHTPAAGPTVQPSANKSIGPPVWTNGKRCPDMPFKASETNTVGFEGVCLSISQSFINQWVGPATFWVAGGL